MRPSDRMHHHRWLYTLWYTSFRCITQLCTLISTFYNEVVYCILFNSRSFLMWMEIWLFSFVFFPLLFPTRSYLRFAKHGLQNLLAFCLVGRDTTTAWSHFNLPDLFLHTERSIKTMHNQIITLERSRWKMTDACYRWSFVFLYFFSWLQTHVIPLSAGHRCTIALQLQKCVKESQNFTLYAHLMLEESLVRIVTIAVAVRILKAVAGRLATGEGGLSATTSSTTTLWRCWSPHMAHFTIHFKFLQFLR